MVTALVRSPAVGLWKESPDDVKRDDVIMFEVVTEELNKAWWANRKYLQDEFHQEELLVWASEITKLLRPAPFPDSGATSPLGA